MNLFDLYAKISLDSTGFEKALSVATSALTTATAAVTAFAGKAVSVGKDFDKAMSQVAATMGYTTEELSDGTSEASVNMNKLRKFAQQMGSETVFSATQAAEALNYMALAGYDAETSMAMLPTVLDLAASGTMDLAQASDMVTDAQSALGLSLEDTAVMVDQMAKTASKSNTSVSQLGDAILTLGGTAKFLKGGTTELNTVLGILADNGIKASEGGTHLRNMLLKLSAPTDDGAAALKALGVAVFDSAGNMRAMQDIFGDLKNVMTDTTPRIKELFGAYEEAKKTGDLDTINGELAVLSTTLRTLGIDMNDGAGNVKSLDDVLQELSDGGLTQATQLTLLSDLFNTRDIAAATALLDTQVDRWEELGTAIDDSADSASKMASTQLDNLAGDITLFKSALEGAQIVISDKLTPGIRNFVKFGSKAVSNITKAFKEGGLSGAMEAFGETLSEGLTMIIEDMPTMVEAGAALLSSLGQGIIDNLPLLMDTMVTVIQSLVNKLIEDIPMFAETMTTMLIAMGESIVKNLPTLITAMFTLITTVGNALLENLPLLIDTVMNILNSIVTYLVDPAQLTLVMNSIVTIIQAVMGKMIENIPMLVDTVMTLLTNITEFIVQNLPMFVKAAGEIIVSLVEGLLKALPDLIKMLPTIIVSIVDTLLDMLPTIVDCGVDLLMALVENMPAIIDGIVKALPQLIMGLTTGLISHLDEIIYAGVKLFLGLIAAMPEIILQIVKSIPAILKGIVGAIINGIPQLMKAGTQLLKGLWQGISDAAGWLWEKISGFFGGILDRIKSFFGIASPSKVFAGIGEMLDKGLAKGIDDYADMAVNAADEMAQDVTDAAYGGDLDFTGSSNTASAKGAGGRSVIINVYGAVGQDVEELAEIVSQKIAFGYRQEQAVWA